MLISSLWPEALTSGLLFLTLTASTSHAAPQIGNPAPALDLPSLVSPASAPKLGPPLPLPIGPGRVVIVDFFATWCVPCQKASLALSEVLPQLGDRVTLIVVDVKESPEVVSQHLAKLPLPKGAKLVFDRDGEAAKRWGQDRFPTTFLVDERGIISHINRGYGPGYKARIDRWLRLMLGIPAQMMPE
jgi:thiol-disulfide isomerase/thioredoxin